MTEFAAWTPDSRPCCRRLRRSAPPAPDGANNWYRNPVTLEAQASDTGSEVLEMRCALDPATAPANYWDLPEGPCPFLGGAHRMYFTGDLARWRRMPDGGAVMEFLGRSDHQVKLRGHRIELGEVESQLHLLPGVAECVAIVRDDNDNDNDMSGDQQLVAYVVAAPGVAVDPVELRESLRTELPEVMVPQHVVLLPAMPRTPNGKLDRSGLPAPHTTKRAGVVTAPTTDSERVVLDAWRTVLGTDEIGVDDNFFDVGGHSLLVVRLHRTLQERLGHPLPLTDLYRYPTVRSFSVSLAESDGEAPIAISNALDRAARRRANMSGRAR